MKNLIKTDRVLAKHFHAIFRFIDDLCSIYDGSEFGNIFKDIYPEELELEKERDGISASFLNLEIWIEDGKFIHKLYDKRDAFPSRLSVCHIFEVIFQAKSFTLL